VRTKKRVGVAVILAGLAVVSVGLVGASPASAEPNPCEGRVDGGTGGDVNVSTGDPLKVTRVYGTWWNCSGGARADRVKVVVNLASDGPCITAPYGTTTSWTKNYTWTILRPSFDRWARC
jgi:hypothetical protein